MVFFSAAWKILSVVNSLMKLFRPMNWMAWRPSQEQNASAMANTMGTSVNTQKPMKFGAMKEYAIRESRVFFLSTLRGAFCAETAVLAIKEPPFPEV